MPNLLIYLCLAAVVVSSGVVLAMPFTRRRRIDFPMLYHPDYSRLSQERWRSNWKFVGYFMIPQVVCLIGYLAFPSLRDGFWFLMVVTAVVLASEATACNPDLFYSGENGVALALAKADHELYGWWIGRGETPKRVSGKMSPAEVKDLIADGYLFLSGLTSRTLKVEVGERSVELLLLIYVGERYVDGPAEFSKRRDKTQTAIVNLIKRGLRKGLDAQQLTRLLCRIEGRTWGGGIIAKFAAVPFLVARVSLSSEPATAG